MSTENPTNRVAWHPLESNPQAMNKFVHKLGVSEQWAYTDIWGLDDELLAIVPQPCVAVILLFPVTDNYEDFRKKETEQINRDGQKVSDKIFYMCQTIRNACGTYAVLHSLLNNRESVGLGDGPLMDFFKKAENATFEERSKILSEAADIAAVHTESAHVGQTETPDANAKIDLHFVCFVQCDGDLYELDGRKGHPVNHGSSIDLLRDTAKVARMFMERDPENVNFNLIALAPNSEL
ncbi:ubiquitin carboxyl-terminal hydrolase isozyme L3-like protein [Syncephalis fuscata]|nr:ubiquitin carboxyl-terminal hydrolase isozyme L3-like protein [Syncephalis fuscata]